MSSLPLEPDSSMDAALSGNAVALPKSLRLGRDEMNLAEFPITLLTDRVPKDQREAIYQDEIFDDRTGMTLTRKLTITAGNHGLTTAIDDEVILALIQITKRKNNFTNPKVEFSRYELTQILGWSVGGASYDRIETSLDRWTSVYLKYENAWRDNRTKTWRSTGFHIIDKYELNDSRMVSEQLDLMPSYFIWGDDIFESFQAGYLKPLDYDLCSGLRHSTAKRMYRFLDKKFFFKTDVVFDLKEFAYGHIGLSQNYEGPSHIKRNLQGAIAELEAVGFLAPMPEGERFFKEGKAWKIRVTANELTTNLPPLLTTVQPIQTVTPLPPFASELIRHGVTESTAVKLAELHHERLEPQIAAFEWLIERGDKRVAKSPAGYLVKSIEDGYAIPKGFVSAAERQGREEAKTAKEQKAAGQARLRRAAAAAAAAHEAAKAAYRDSFSPNRLAELETAAIASASEEARQNLSKPMMRKYRDTMIQMLIKEHIDRIMPAPQATEPA